MSPVPAQLKEFYASQEQNRHQWPTLLNIALILWSKNILLSKYFRGFR